MFRFPLCVHACPVAKSGLGNVNNLQLVATSDVSEDILNNFFSELLNCPICPILLRKSAARLSLSPWRLICSVGALGRAFYTNGSGGGFDMGMNKACDFQGAYVAFVERLEKDPKFPRFGGAKITSSCLSALQFRIEIDPQSK